MLLILLLLIYMRSHKHTPAVTYMYVLKQYLVLIGKSHFKSQKLFKTFYNRERQKASKQEHNKEGKIPTSLRAKGKYITNLFVLGTQFISQQSESMNLSLHGWAHQLAFELEDRITQLTLRLALSGNTFSDGTQYFSSKMWMSTVKLNLKFQLFFSQLLPHLLQI